MKIASLLLVLSLGLSQLQAQAAEIAITGLPITITQSGDYYFAADLVSPYANRPAITVAANDVVLDLRNHTLTAPNQTAITVAGNNAIIRNGIIKAQYPLVLNDGFQGTVVSHIRGESTYGVSNTAADSTFDHCAFHGIACYNSGVTVTNCYLWGGMVTYATKKANRQQAQAYAVTNALICGNTSAAPPPGIP